MDASALIHIHALLLRQKKALDVAIRKMEHLKAQVGFVSKVFAQLLTESWLRTIAITERSAEAREDPQELGTACGTLPRSQSIELGSHGTATYSTAIAPWNYHSDCLSGNYIKRAKCFKR